MGKYKINKLKILEEGIFIYNNKEIPEKHILPKDKYRLNIIKEYRDEFFNSEYKDIKFHKYFHHLNSSQAMCINLFYPLIKENYLGLILDIIGLQSENISEINYAEFEKKSDLEDGARLKTNFDFYIELKSGIKIYFEIKYTENGFGKVEHNPKYKDKFNNIYKVKLAANTAIKETFKSEEYFLDNYQIMRNIVHINNDSYVVFLYPQENSNIRKQALITRKEVIEDSFTDHFICYTLEEMVEQLILRLPSGKLKDYYKEQFTYKYL